MLRPCTYLHPGICLSGRRGDEDCTWVTLSMWLSKEKSTGIPALKHCNWNFLRLELPWPILSLQEQSLCELFCDGKRCKRRRTWHLLHHFPRCIRYESAHRLRDTLSVITCVLCVAQRPKLSLSKLPLEVLNQMVSADEGLGANERDSGGSQTTRVSFPRIILHTAPSMLEVWLGVSIVM